ncbi:helix-turn-helix domain protein [Pseudonocardia dioxanivorans CB1190]|uniref:Helix-turn-helix domain protein n=1 Tax=Pseudonocardia dioxanivorans (strain ATCC 55486 / DSM 44775 / JCM 13855 / CB1190) TaxID=675635 RepID=F4CSF3_PSEUX|nr:helix-turn-helix transcriptional regulator [Pseudonocardia dioxanivorans]AEA23127.1 helix-turn-helix domain protein [Pseudonocardia dioxanivorans CB1190]
MSSGIVFDAHVESRGEPVTGVIARRVRELRDAARLSGADLAERMNDLGIAWNRTTVAKLETGRRATVTVQELLALGRALDVPPIILIADPRRREPVPLVPGEETHPWEALLWLSGAGRVGESDLDNQSRASWLIQAGWHLEEAVADLHTDERYVAGDDDAAQALDRTAARHRAALRAIRTSAIRIVGAGAELPPWLPLDYIRRRASELDFDLPPQLRGD